MGTAAAIAGSAVIGGITSERAGEKAASAQRQSAAAIQKAAQEARSDVSKLYPQAMQALLTGAQGAFDVFGRSIPLQQQQLTAGNLAAQQAVSGGFDRAQAALLGSPVEGFESSIAGVPFSEEPIFGGSIIGTPQNFELSGFNRGVLPTFAGLGGSFRPGREVDPIDPTTGQPLPEFGQNAQGTPIQNPNIFLGDELSLTNWPELARSYESPNDPYWLGY